MKKILLLLVVSFFIAKNSEAQNLVPNPSFEDTVACPIQSTPFIYCQSWHAYRPSTDYYNSCSSLFGVPQNFAGYQMPSSGSAYCGLISYTWPNGREILGCQLITPLIAGTKYYASIKVSLADSSTYANNKIGIALSTIEYDESSIWAPINNQAKVISSSIIMDTSNWVIVSGSFIADSVYNYLMIGTFFLDSNIDTISVPYTSSINNPNEAYYYIDDVCVSPDSLACDLNPEGIYNLKEAKESINLYPNPATNQLTVESTKAINTIEITDAIGRVQSFKFKVQRPSTQIDIHALASGIYFIKVYFCDGTMEVKKFVKE